VPKAPFSEKAVPSFADAPATVLIVGDVEFFVEEAAAKVREKLADAETEVLPFEDDAQHGHDREALERGAVGAVLPGVSGALREGNAPDLIP